MFCKNEINARKKRTGKVQTFKNKNCEFLGPFLKLSMIEIPMEDIRKIWQKEKI